MCQDPGWRLPIYNEIDKQKFCVVKGFFFYFHKIII